MIQFHIFFAKPEYILSSYTHHLLETCSHRAHNTLAAVAHPLPALQETERTTGFTARSQIPNQKLKGWIGSRSSDFEAYQTYAGACRWEDWSSRWPRAPRHLGFLHLCSIREFGNHITDESIHHAIETNKGKIFATCSVQWKASPSGETPPLPPPPSPARG
jgi:hypothetical protein